MGIGNILHYKNTGKVVSLVITALYAVTSYYFMAFIKKSIDEKSINTSLAIILILFVVGIINVIKDIATDELDMQSPANKEREAHNKTKELLSKKESEIKGLDKLLTEKKEIIHALQSTLNNTLISKKDSEEVVDAIKDIMIKVNQNKNVNNIQNIKSSKANPPQDYLSLFTPPPS
ncbi:hypothetical protein [Aeromonas eucrenophila]|uniref:Uncharacterized protein n=1 Tax=Aeromonas eucrenophila TaxID=649 RepID=A0ABW0Y614_9GAMM|nr:hypothetical protein [Aeromonas eucrenophila]